jgi:hypothetical protein
MNKDQLGQDRNAERLTEEQQKTLEEISVSFTRFCDSITEEERAEMRDWANVAEASLSSLWPSETFIPHEDEDASPDLV